MTKKDDNLWPDFNFEDIKTPLSVLQKQANNLGEKTKNIIIGEVNTTEAFDEKTNEMVLIYQLYIKAPILNNYRYLLLRLFQRTDLFPVDIYYDPEKEKFENIEEDGLEEQLKTLFTKPKTQEIIKSLYAQSIQMNKNNDTPT